MFLGNDVYESITFMDWVGTLSTSFISFYFIAFVLLLLFLYYIVPRKVRWTILLTGSMIFYSLAGWKVLWMVLCTTLIVYCCALCIEVAPKRQKKVFLFTGVFILLGMLVFCKLYGLCDMGFSFVVPLGISYYTFSAISYMADVYYGKDQAETNYFKILLFVLFFPKILQGPISRHSYLGRQLTEGNRASFRDFVYGFQLVIYGYFKKLVIADRIGIFTTSVIQNQASMGGSVIGLTLGLAAIQLYSDFSGCMDIASGISEMFGIRLEQNFDHPFFSRSAAEFWRRWHVTLGSWFKDYVYMPIVSSKLMMKLVSLIGKRFGRKAGRNVMTIIPLATVWLLTGLWHGTGWNYVIWGVYWGVLIISGTVFARQYRKAVDKCHIDTSSGGWHLFQMVRTFLLFCFSRAITIPGDLKTTWEWIVKLFMDVRPWQLFDGTLYGQGLTWKEYWLMQVFILALFLISMWQEKAKTRGSSVRVDVNGKNVILASVGSAAAIVFILVFGIYGSGSGTSGFAYMQF